MKQSLNSFIEGFKAAIHLTTGHPLTKATEAVQDAARIHCRRFAETQYQQMLADFYAVQAAAVDPYIHWREFANLKDKWQDHYNDMLVESSRYRDADGKLRAATKRLEVLKAKYT